MKETLSSIPSQGELEKAYDLLLHQHPQGPTPQMLALYSQWARFDPRFSEIWVHFVSRHWPKINPMELREHILTQPWPATIGVLLEFTATGVSHQAIVSNARLLNYWKKIVTDDLPLARYEQFFLGLRVLGGELMEEDARFSLKEYTKWGYFGREILFNKAPSRAHTRRERHTRTACLEPLTRLEVIKSILETSSRITTDIYWERLGHCISRRQAERDLKKCRFLKPIGRTRGRVFVARRRRSGV